MYRALVAGDASYDGVFFAAVRTTGIFCRPSCRARKPRAENTEFFPSARAAVDAGYRPCRKCHPLDRSRAAPEWVERLLELAEGSAQGRASDAELRRQGIEPARARRHFKERYGMTFHAYQRTRRMGLALAEIRSGGDPTRAAFDHGYESVSGFREAFKRTFGRPPAAGARETAPLLARWLETPLGTMVAVDRGGALALLEFTDRRALTRELEQLTRRAGAPVVPGESEVLATVERELARYFEGSLTAFSVACDPGGTPFQARVWRRLAEIPYGETISYDRLARELGRPGAQRAVGRANGQNTCAIVIPCHRVIRADGSLSGYGGGVWRKQRLLELEGQVRARAPR